MLKAVKRYNFKLRKEKQSKKTDSKTDLIQAAEKSRPTNEGNIEGTTTSFATTKQKMNK